MSSTNKTPHYNLPQFIGSDIPTWLGDFNSAMTAIDSGINAAATSASGAATTAAQALEAAHRCPFPVGFGGFFQTDPNTIYSGTKWEQKKDVFILAAGDTYTAGSTGGEAEHVLTVAEIAKHYHVQSVEVPNGIVMQVEKDSSGTGPFNGTPVVQPGEWITNGNAIETKPAGGSQPHNNMPPYFAMPFWIRTA